MGTWEDIQLAKRRLFAALGARRVDAPVAPDGGPFRGVGPPATPEREGPPIPAGDATLRPLAWRGGVGVTVAGVAEDEARMASERFEWTLGPQRLADLCETATTGRPTHRSVSAFGRRYPQVFSLEPLSPDYELGAYVFFYPPRQDWMTLRVERAPLSAALRAALDWLDSNASGLGDSDAADLRRARRALDEGAAAVSGSGADAAP